MKALTNHPEKPFKIPDILGQPDILEKATQLIAELSQGDGNGRGDSDGAESTLQRRLGGEGDRPEGILRRRVGGGESDAERALLRRPSGFGFSRLNSIEPPPAQFAASEPPLKAEPPTITKPRRLKFWLFAVLASVAIVAPIGADTSLPGRENRNFALVVAPEQPLPGTAATVASAAATDDENQPSRTDWSDRAAQLQIVLPTLVASSDPIAGSATSPVATPLGPMEAVNPSSAVAENAAVPPSVQTSPRDSAVQGVSDKEILFGMAAPFGGASRELGRQMKIGVETAFSQINDGGGVNGRLLRLVTADDGYEPTRTADVMKSLYDKDQVFGFIGNVGTPTAAVALPFALDHRALFFGAFTGAGLLRRDPPDRYVFNYRASYAEETNAVVNYLVKVRRIQPREIVVFAQQDSYGDSGYAGVQKAVRSLPGENPDIVRLNYKRNTVDVQDAVNALRAFRGQIKAVVMVASYRAAAKFIEKTRDLYPSMIYTNVSFVGSTALADELMLLGPKYATGAIVTQVVPAINSYATIVLKYKESLAKYYPGESPDYVSFEGYIDASILAEAVKRVGRDINTEKLVDELERMHDFDLGLGAPLTFSSNEHQGSHKVWGTQLDEAGHYQPIDLE